MAGAARHASQKCDNAMGLCIFCLWQSGGNRLFERPYRYVSQMWNLSDCRHYIWARLQFISKTSSGQMPQLEWSSSPSHVCVKTSKRQGGGGCIPTGLKLDENVQWLVPGGLPALSEIPGTLKGSWGISRTALQQDGWDTMPLERLLHITTVATPSWAGQSPHAWAPCRAPCCSHATHCPGRHFLSWAVLGINNFWGEWKGLLSCQEARAGGTERAGRGGSSRLPSGLCLSKPPLSQLAPFEQLLGKGRCVSWSSGNFYSSYK